MDINKLGPIDLLLVEDDTDFSYSLNSRLKKRNFNVTCVVSAEEALQILSGSEFDVVVTDIKLQGLDGIALLEKIKELNEYLPVILITGYASLNTAREAVKLDAFDYLLKPFESVEDILKPIYKAVYSYRLERENRRLFDSLWSKMYELERSRQKYQDLFDSAGDIIYTVDKKGIFTSVNKKMEEITRYKSEELLGRPDSLFILSVNEGSFKAKTKNVLGGAPGDTVDVKIRNRDGQVRFGELGMRPIHEGDEIVGMQCIFRDMTERKKSDEEIKRLKEYYEDIVLSVPNAILTINKSLEIESANKTFYSMFGRF
ncbi:MAG: PAS domain S-box protein [Spirochaetes bacterium]|nr:PAS domain S-box protein [Spirochaetota bacterium]